MIEGTQGLQWEKVTHRGGSPPIARFGHSMNAIGTRLFIFGGVALSNNKQAQCLNDLHVYDTGNKYCKELPKQNVIHLLLISLYIYIVTQMWREMDVRSSLGIDPLVPRAQHATGII